MRLAAIGLVVMMFVLPGHGAGQQSAAPRQAGILLENVSWRVAEDRLKPDAVVILPLAPAAVEHGLHLPLGTDRRLAEYLIRRIVADVDVVVAPPLAYHHLPAFAEYPGSTSLAPNTARDLTADVARSLAAHGPRRFYALNTSLSPVRALPEAAKVLAAEGLLLRYTDAPARLDTTIRSIQRQPFGAHGDEIETSMMLYVDAAAVEMSRATRELGPESNPFLLTRREGGRGTYSPSGAWGDATQATREKGGLLVEALLRAVRADIEDLRRTSPPVAATAPAPSAALGPSARSGIGGAGRRPDECLPGDDRAIRGLGPAFSLAWINQDAARIAQFWSPEGDMVHPDGYIEGSQLRILENRTALFMRPEYKNSRHSLMFGNIRCIASDIAIADAKWELRNVTDARGQIVPPSEGLCTLVLRRRPGAGWSIEAWRYSNKPAENVTQPTLLKRPGYPGTGK